MMRCSRVISAAVLLFVSFTLADVNIYVDKSGLATLPCGNATGAGACASLSLAIQQLPATENAVIGVSAGVFSGPENLQFSIDGSAVAGNISLVGAGIDVTTFGPPSISNSSVRFARLTNGAHFSVTGVTLQFFSKANGKNGGVFEVESSSVLHVDTVHFFSNQASNGGAISFSGAGASTITNSTFQENTVFQSLLLSEGGAILSVDTPLVISSSDFVGNEAKSPSGGAGASGGAIYSNGGSLTILESTFDTNIASADARATGGAVAVSGGSALISHSEFGSNSVLSSLDADGGAIFLQSGAVGTVSDCSIIDNQVKVGKGVDKYYNQSEPGSLQVVTKSAATVAFTGNNAFSMSCAVLLGCTQCVGNTTCGFATASDACGVASAEFIANLDCSGGASEVIKIKLNTPASDFDPAIFKLVVSQVVGTAQTDINIDSVTSISASQSEVVFQFVTANNTNTISRLVAAATTAQDNKLNINLRASELVVGGTVYPVNGASTPSPAVPGPTPEADGSVQAWVIAVAVGATVFVFVLIGVAVFMHQRKKHLAEISNLELKATQGSYNRMGS